MYFFLHKENEAVILINRNSMLFEDKKNPKKINGTAVAYFELNIFIEYNFITTLHR